MDEDYYSLRFLSLIKTRRHQDAEETPFNCTHKTLIADALFTVIITTTVFDSHFSLYSFTVRGSKMKDVLFVHDFILIVVIQ